MGLIHAQFHISLLLPLDGYNNRLTVHGYTIAKSLVLAGASFSSLFDVHGCLGGL